MVGRKPVTSDRLPGYPDHDQATKVAGVTSWEPDVLPGYSKQTIPLGIDPNGEGELVATLVRRGEGGRSRHAVLATHGYTDYFFNTELADHFVRRGMAFYALDLHKCGRSRLANQTPHFTTNLAGYDRELDRALALVRADTDGARICMYGHSTGGLVVPLWMNRLRDRALLSVANIGGLVLNSPFLDLQGPAILRAAPTSAALIALARLRKMQVVRKPTEGGYGSSLHRDHGGEFDFDLDWKPLGGFPVTVGWINAIRRAQARLHRGLDVGVPNLILRSDHSVTESPNSEAIQRGDAVLDVAHIARWAGCIGNRTTIVPIPDAKHDVFLSVPEARAAAYRELDAWLDGYLDTTTPSTTTTRSGQG
jgi:alpha-beta hydrolase superfamily lysophospholipase